MSNDEANVYPSDLKTQDWGTVFHEISEHGLGLKTAELVKRLQKKKLDPDFFPQLFQLDKYPSLPNFRRLESFLVSQEDEPENLNSCSPFDGAMVSY